MKKPLFYSAIVLSLVVLGAHFMRYGNIIGMVISLLAIALLFVRALWAARAVQAVLVLGALEWARTLYTLASLRIAHEQPYARLAVILGVVILIAVLAALSFQTKTLRDRYKSSSTPTST
jgi:hypothetical protein